MALVFIQLALLADVSCHAVPGSPVIPYVNLYFWGIFLLGSSSKDDVEDWEDIIWKCLFEGILEKLRGDNRKTGHFTSLMERERLWNVQKWKMRLQSIQNYCFSLLNMQMYDVLVVVLAT